MWHTDDYDDSLHLQCDPSLWHFANFPWFPNVNEGAIWRDSGFPFPTTHFLGWGRWSYFLSLAEFIQRHFFKRIFAMWSISASLTWSKKSTAAFLPLGRFFCVAGCGWGTFKSPKNSGTWNGGTEPYKAILGAVTAYIGEDSSILGTWNLGWFKANFSLILLDRSRKDSQHHSFCVIFNGTPQW